MHFATHMFMRRGRCLTKFVSPLWKDLCFLSWEDCRHFGFRVAHVVAEFFAKHWVVSHKNCHQESSWTLCFHPSLPSAFSLYIGWLSWNRQVETMFSEICSKCSRSGLLAPLLSALFWGFAPNMARFDGPLASTDGILHSMIATVTRLAFLLRLPIVFVIKRPNPWT